VTDTSTTTDLQTSGFGPAPVVQPRAPRSVLVAATVSLVALTLSFTAVTAETDVAGASAASLMSAILVGLAALGMFRVFLFAMLLRPLSDVGLAVAAAAPLIVSLALAAGRLEVSYAAFAAAESVACVLLVVVARRADIRAVASAALALLVGLSLIAAALLPSLVIAGRDFLPLLYDGRVGGLMGHPNGMGLISGLLVLASMSRRGLTRVLLVGLGALGLAASASQTSTIATVAALLVMALAALWLRTRTVSGRLALVAVFLVVGAGLLFALTYTDVTTALTSGDTVDTSFSGRTGIWASLLDNGAVPALGLGHADTAQLISSLTRVGSTHNVWIDAYLVDGLIGMLALGISAVAFVVAAGREFRAGSAVGVGIVTSFAIVGLTESGPTHPAFFLLFVCAALGLSGLTTPAEVLDSRAPSGLPAPTIQTGRVHR